MFVTHIFPICMNCSPQNTSLKYFNFQSLPVPGTSILLLKFQTISFILLWGPCCIAISANLGTTSRFLPLVLWQKIQHWHFPATFLERGTPSWNQLGGKIAKYFHIRDKTSRICMKIFFLLLITSTMSHLYLNIFRMFHLNLEVLSKHWTVM